MNILHNRHRTLPFICFVDCDVPGYRGFQLIRHGSKSAIEMNGQLTVPNAFLLGALPTHFAEVNLERTLHDDKRKAFEKEIESQREFFYENQRIINLYSMVLTKNAFGSLTVVNAKVLMDELKSLITHFSKEELCLLPSHPEYFTFVNKLAFYETSKYSMVESEFLGLEEKYNLIHEYVHKFCAIINTKDELNYMFAVTYLVPQNCSFGDENVQIVQTDSLSYVCLHFKNNVVTVYNPREISLSDAHISNIQRIVTKMFKTTNISYRSWLDTFETNSEISMDLKYHCKKYSAMWCAAYAVDMFCNVPNPFYRNYPPSENLAQWFWNMLITRQINPFSIN